MPRKRQPVDATALTRDSLELLLDLVEIKLGCIEVYDRDDARELRTLEATRNELAGILGRPMAAVPVIATSPPAQARRSLI